MSRRSAFGRWLAFVLFTWLPARPAVIRNPEHRSFFNGR